MAGEGRRWAGQRAGRMTRTGRRCQRRVGERCWGCDARPCQECCCEKRARASVGVRQKTCGPSDGDEEGTSPWER
jgi:hypothetical protein